MKWSTGPIEISMASRDDARMAQYVRVNSDERQF